MGVGVGTCSGQGSCGKGHHKGRVFFHGQLMGSDLGSVRTKDHIKYSLCASHFKAFSRTLWYLVFVATL